MDNFGSEIGQKMRSAVKAKLVELGTGGTAGYIDDELPDYVMIMVANKRSKQQMIADLNLFLGSQTDLFVTWLHEVLQKLQEVTLPAVSATKKRKAEPKQDSISKKDRKNSKKERKNSTSKKSSDEVQSSTVHTTEKHGPSKAPSVPPINSITDVFADAFLEKAKKNLSTATEAAAHIKKAKGGAKAPATETSKTATPKSSNDYSKDISESKEQGCNGSVTESGISNNKNGTSATPIISGNREKDLAELAEIQKKIFAAKKHLRQLGELDDNSEDEDFINLKEDGTEEEQESASPREIEKNVQSPTKQRSNRRRSPIVFDADENGIDEPKSTEQESAERSRHFTPPPINSATTNSNTVSERQNDSSGCSQPLPKQQSLDSGREREPVTDKSRNREQESEDQVPEVAKKPVHERLGVRPSAGRDSQQITRRPRDDKPIFIPSFRRKDNENERFRERGNEKEHEREKDREREHDKERLRERERERERERQRERERERERERQRERERIHAVTARMRGRSEDRRKDRDLERERERQRERGRDRSRDIDDHRRKASVPTVRRSLSPIIRRTTSNTDNRPLSNITVSTIVNPNYVKKAVNENENDDGDNSTTSDSSSESEDSNEDHTGTTSLPQNQRQRIGSRVIVAPVKQVESSEEEDKSLNSVIKIKPRATVSPSKQACKTLLLRAVAEAQRSTIIKSRHKEPVPNKKSNIIKDPTDERKLYTKAYRERLNSAPKVSSTSATTSNLFRRATQNLVIKVERDMPLRKQQRAAANIVEDEGHVQIELVDEDGDEEELEEKYVPGTALQRVDSKINYMYVPQMLHIKNEKQESDESEEESDESSEEVISNSEQPVDKAPQTKTQFVVTLNDEKAALKFMARSSAARKRARSQSPLQEVSSSSSISRSKRVEASSTTSTISTQAPRRSTNRETEHSRRTNIKSRLSAKVVPSSTVPRISDHESSNSLPATPPLKRADLIETYRKPKEIKKIIIKNDTDDEEMSPKKLSSTIVINSGGQQQQQQQRKHKATHNEERSQISRRSATPSPRRSDTSKGSKTPPKRKRTPSSIHYDGRSRKDLIYDSDEAPASKRSRTDSDDSAHERERGREREREHEHNRKRERERERERERATSRDYSAERHNGEERRKISTRNAEAKKYENIPSLSSVTLDSTAVRVMKTKERCKYHPNCTKQFCDYYHPTAPCKSFPNCKFADKCLYSHPHCKYDLACTNLDCNYAHSGPRDPAQLVPQAPPLSSHVVPVQNYKSISAPTAASTTMCKYYPTCTKAGCTFYHPKPCRFGKNCINKLECNFYHHEVQSSNKFKWVAGVV
ncbi:unnamed protein product [Ceratitis capitata]|uniref:Zinc finger CCCH domain-containing protein 14 n=1 Tax=Ceratitis capitata TaxID=7213 RepID=A0A811TX23_CERCA|nr:unnamed protein product [Ceratitis capitata]